jgi:hypothetical protein
MGWGCDSGIHFPYFCALVGDSYAFASGFMLFGRPAEAASAFDAENCPKIAWRAIAKSRSSRQGATSRDGHDSEPFSKLPRCRPLDETRYYRSNSLGTGCKPCIQRSIARPEGLAPRRSGCLSLSPVLDPHRRMGILGKHLIKSRTPGLIRPGIVRATYLKHGGLFKPRNRNIPLCQLNHSSPQPPSKRLSTRRSLFL